MGFADNNSLDFDEPIANLETGELLHDDDGAPGLVITYGPNGVLAVDTLDGEPATAVLASTAMQAIDTAAADLGAFTGALRRDLEERIDTTYAAAYAARPVHLSPGIGKHEGEVVASRPTQADVAPELALLGDQFEVLDALAKVFAEASLRVRSIAGDVVQEVQWERDVAKTGGTTSVKVGARGSAIKTTVTQATETWTEDTTIVDVLVATLVPAADGEALEAELLESQAYALGAREGIAGYTALLAAPKFKITALDALRDKLQGAGDFPLAERLNRAYGKRAKGDPRTTIERVAAKD